MIGAGGIDGGGCGALHAVMTALTDLRNLINAMQNRLINQWNGMENSNTADSQYNG